MRLTVYRIRTYTRYEYMSEREIDTTKFPECEGMTARERLQWCQQNPDRVWDGEFDEWLNGESFDHDREHDFSVFLYGKEADAQFYKDVVHEGTGFDADDIGNKYPRKPTPEEWDAATDDDDDADADR